MGATLKELSAGVERGGVRKGEKGVPIIYWNFTDQPKVAEDDKPPHRIPWARLSYAWNVEQCRGVVRSEGGKLADYVKPERAKEPLAAAQAIHDNYQLTSGVTVKIGGSVACYIPNEDAIRLPAIESFDNAAEWHGVRFHEEVHSTGATDRLSRNLSDVLNSNHGENYGAEELVAELGSAMLRATTGIEVNYVNSAAYIAGWSKVLTDQPRMFTQAAGRAQKAVDYILGDGRREEKD